MEKSSSNSYPMFVFYTKEDKKYTLSINGDCEGQSKTKNAKKILDIINKYS